MKLADTFVRLLGDAPCGLGFGKGCFRLAHFLVAGSPVRLGLDGFGLSQRRAGLIDPGFHFGAVDDQQEISLSDAGSVSHKLFQYPARELGGNIHARGVDFALREVPVIRDVKHAGHGQQNDGKTYQAEKNCGGGCGFFHHKFLYGWPC